MNFIIQVTLLVALIESAHLRVITSLTDTTTVDPIDQSTTSRPKAKTIDTFVPIADLLNVIAGIQDQLPPLRVRVASFPVSPDLSIKSQTTTVEPIEETSTAATVQSIEASPVAPSFATVTDTNTLVPVESSVRTNIVPSPVVPDVIPAITELTTLASPTTEAPFPTAIMPNVDSFVTLAPFTAPPTLPEIVTTPQTIPVEVAAPQEQPAASVFTTTNANVIDQTNIVDSIVPIGTARFFS